MPALLLPGAVGAELKLENELLSLSVNPTGGRINRLELRAPALELTSGDGLLGDNFHHVPEAKFFLTALPYTVSQTGNKLELRANHRGGGIDFLELSKTIELAPGETMARVRYRFHNLPASMATVEYGFWSQNFMGVPGREMNCFFPCLNGIQTVPATRAGTPFTYYKKPSRGWLGYALPEGGGLAVTMDYALLDQFYGWFGDNGCTQEFYFDKFKLAQDESRETELELIAFHTLKRISGAGGGLVGDMHITELPGNGTGHRIELELYSARAQEIRLEFTGRRLRDGEPDKIAERKVSFDQGGMAKAVSLEHNFRVSPAILDVEARAFDADGKLLAIFNAPLGIGTGTLSYRMRPELDRPRDKGAQIDLQRVDRELKPSGIEWAKPLAGGRLRITALVPYQSYPEVAELAAGLDAELYTTLLMAQGRPANTSGDYFGLLSEADLSDNLDALLQKPCDVILMAGINADKLSAAQRQDILSKVEAGCGLVMIGCNGKDQTLAAVSPLKTGTEKNYPKAPPRKTREGFLATAIPWEFLPVTTCLPLVADGEVWAKVQGLPYLAIRPQGKGRVAALSWISSGGQGRMVGGVTPELAWPLPGAYYRDYPACYYLLLAKTLLAAAGRDGNMQFSAINAVSAPGKFTLEVGLDRIPPDPGQCSITLFTRSRDGVELARCEYRFVPQAVQSFKLLTKAWNGPEMIGLILRNAQGEVVDFGAVPGLRLPMARIHSLTADKTHYQEGETAVFTMKAAVEARPAEVRWQLCDAFDRVVRQGAIPAAADMAITVPIRSSLKSRNFTLIAEMFLQGEVVDRHLAKVTATPAPEKLAWLDYEVGLWITPYSYEATRSWLHPELAKAFRAMHVSMIMGNGRDVDLDFALQNNFEPTIYQSNGMRPSPVDKNFHKTQDKMLLKRSPCLSDPAFRAEMQKCFAELGKKYQEQSVRFYWFGDELSLTGYWSSAIDFCFSPSCLAHFAEFLKKKYGTVEQANAQWGTGYSDFKEFIPATLPEVRERKDGNFSAWADHLEYMDQLLAEYITFFTGQTALRAGDPGARSFISGPQGPSAYGGNNWALQGPAYTGLMSYPFGGLQEILHSFAPETIDLPWILGYANYDGKVCYELWRSLQLRAKGAMTFSAASIIRSDYSLSRSGAAAARYLPEIVEGTGKLLITALREMPPDVEIVYSQPSIRAAYVANRAKPHDEVRRQYITLCRNFGIPFRFTSEAEIEKGSLTQHQPRLLIFPDSAALSDRTLAALSDYLKNGGTVLADGNFAIMDASCRMRPDRTLPAGEKLLRHDSLEVHYYDFWNNPALQRESRENAVLAETRAWFKSVLDKAGIVPRCKLELADGSAYLDAEIALFADARANTYVIAISKESQPVTVTARFAPEAAQTVDIRHAGTALKDDNPLFFALLAKSEDAMPALTVSGAGRDFVLNADLNARRDTVFRLTVRDPKGNESSCYGANLAAPGGQSRHPLEFALNDVPGRWSVEVRDVVTGKTATQTIEVK